MAYPGARARPPPPAGAEGGPGALPPDTRTGTTLDLLGFLFHPAGDIIHVPIPKPQEVFL